MAPGSLSPCRGHSATMIWGGLYIFGGTNGTTVIGDGASYDPVSNKLNSIATYTNFGVGKYGHTATWTGSVIVMCGGNNSYGSTAHCIKYNPGTNTWAECTYTPGQYTPLMHSLIIPQYGTELK
jgi:hypothetical protein